MSVAGVVGGVGGNVSKKTEFLYLSRHKGGSKAEDERFVLSCGPDAVFLRPARVEVGRGGEFGAEVGVDAGSLEKMVGISLSNTLMYFVMEQKPFVFFCLDCRTVGAYWQDPETGVLTSVAWSRAKFNGSPGKSVEGRRVSPGKNISEAGESDPKKDNSLSGGLYYLDAMEQVVWFGITVHKSKKTTSKQPWRIDSPEFHERVVTFGFSMRRSNGSPYFKQILTRTNSVMFIQFGISKSTRTPDTS